MNSLFGGGSNKEPSKEGVYGGVPTTSVVAVTGGQVDAVASNLIAVAADSNAEVSHTVIQAVHDIGYRQPQLIISTCAEWLRSHPKGDKRHKIIVLDILSKLLGEKLSDIGNELAAVTLQLALLEMTRDRDVVPDLQTAAANVVVAFSTKLPNVLLDELLRGFEPGTMPHYFVVKCLGDIALHNPLDVVPRLEGVLSRMIPMLGVIKIDAMRWIFATAIFQFCEAIQNYAANANSKDRGLGMTSFSSHMFPAYELLFSKWAVSGERKLRLATVKSIGSMTAIFTPEQYDAEAPRIIPALVGLLRKEREHLAIVQGLCTVLDVGVRTVSAALEPLVLSVMSNLHTDVCIVPDYSNTAQQRNFSEALRCFEIMARGTTEQVLTFVLSRLESKDMSTRLGGLTVLKHLVISVDEVLEDKKGLLVSGVKPLVLAEPSIIVRKVQPYFLVIISMASHHYLELEGGELLVEFVVRCASFEAPSLSQSPTKKSDAATEGLLELRDIAGSVLKLATSTIPDMEQVFWPYLFELLVPKPFGGAQAVVAHCLEALATRKREAGAEDYFIDFDRYVNLPKPQAIIARLLVVVHLPGKRGQLGAKILGMLQAIGPVLHPAVSDMWDEKLPRLLEYLSEHLPTDDQEWKSPAWEDLILRLLLETLRLVNDDEWIIEYGNSLSDHFEVYRNKPYLKKMALRHMGIVLQRVGHKEFIRQKMDNMFDVANHAIDQESEGCAMGYGYIAATHLDIVLEKATTYVVPNMYSKGGGFFSKRKEVPGVLNTLLLIFGYVTCYANVGLITSRIDVQIINIMRPYLQSIVTASNKVAALRSLKLIAQSLHPSHLQNPYVFKPRDDMLKAVIEFCCPSKGSRSEVTHAVRRIGLQVMTELVALEPPLSPELERSLVSTVVYLFGLPNDTRETTEISDVFLEVGIFLTMLLFMQTNILQLNRLLEHIGPWAADSDPIRRQRALQIILVVLKKFIQFSTGEGAVGRVDQVFSELGRALSLVLPRCADPDSSIRKIGVECLGLMLYIDYLLKNSKGSETPSNPPELRPFVAIREAAGEEASVSSRETCEQLASVLCKMLDEQELPRFLLASFPTLSDSQPLSTIGVATAVHGMLQTRGSELLPHIPEMVRQILAAIEGISPECKETYSISLSAFRELARHHLLPVLKELLEQPVPHSIHVQAAIQELVKDNDLVIPVCNHLWNILNNGQLHEEKSKKFVPLALPLAATGSLCDILLLPDMESIVLQHYSQFFCTVLLRLGTAAGVESKAMPQKPGKDGKVNTMMVSALSQAEKAFRSLISFPSQNAVLEAMDKSSMWSSLGQPSSLPDALQVIAGAMAESCGDKMTEVFQFLLPYIRGNYINQRIVTSTVFAEFVRHCKDKPELLHSLVETLVSSLNDMHIKIHALHGLGNLHFCGEGEANKYASTVLDALTSNLEDLNEAISMESMVGLSKLFEVVDEFKVAPVMVNLCHRIHPAFEKPSPRIRAASFQLFGALARFGGSQICADRFYNQLHCNFPTLLLHMHEDSPEVQIACKVALVKLAPLMRAEPLSAVFLDKGFDPEKTIARYDLLMEKVAGLLIEHYPERLNEFVMACVEFFKTKSDRLKANAAILVGCILGQLPVEKRGQSHLNPPIVISALLQLLHGGSAEVRKRAAVAASLLYTY